VYIERVRFTPDPELLGTVPEEFALPDYAAPIDVEARLAVVPPEATVKGMYFASLLEEAQRRRTPLEVRWRIVPFRDYPLRAFHELVLEAARAWWPGEPPREQLRRVGQLAFPAMQRSLVGKVMFGALGGDVGAMMRLSPKGWTVSLSHARVELVDSGARHVVLRFAGIYSWLDCYEPGILEGGLMAVGRPGVVALRSRTLTEGDLYVAWR
jgi:uncharacterized protein (TIGR02265 family)